MNQSDSDDISSICKIRKGTLADVDVIAHHRAAMFVDMRSVDSSNAAVIENASKFALAKHLADGDYLAWLVEIDGNVVAGAGVMLRKLLPRPKNLDGGVEAQVLNVYTEPAFRSKGLARKLMSAIFAWCEDEGIKRISLHASDAGLPLYQSLGFLPTNEMRIEP